MSEKNEITQIVYYIMERANDQMEDGISASGGDITVWALVEKYTSQRRGMHHSTKAGYKTILNILVKEAFGKKQIKDARLSDAKEWLLRLQAGSGLSVSYKGHGICQDKPRYAEKLDGPGKFLKA